MSDIQSPIWTSYQQNVLQLKEAYTGHIEVKSRQLAFLLNGLLSGANKLRSAERARRKTDSDYNDERIGLEWLGSIALGEQRVLYSAGRAVHYGDDDLHTVLKLSEGGNFRVNDQDLAEIGAFDLIYGYQQGECDLTSRDVSSLESWIGDPSEVRVPRVHAVVRVPDAKFEGVLCERIPPHKMIDYHVAEDETGVRWLVDIKNIPLTDEQKALERGKTYLHPDLVLEF